MDNAKTAACYNGLAGRVSHLDLHANALWPGVRRAGLPEAEPGADAGPAAPKAPP